LNQIQGQDSNQGSKVWHKNLCHYRCYNCICPSGQNLHRQDNLYAHSETQQDRLKTVQTANCLVEPFVESHWTIYVDTFYTSLDLLKSLAEKNLYITRTMLANHIPQGIWLAKNSTAFKQLKRGDALKCKVCLRTESGEASEAGLVCWRDWNMVYCLSNDSNNFQFDECSHRGLGGII
jgi:hypothetical protein